MGLLPVHNGKEAEHQEGDLVDSSEITELDLASFGGSNEAVVACCLRVRSLEAWLLSMLGFGTGVSIRRFVSWLHKRKGALLKDWDSRPPMQTRSRNRGR